MPSDTNKDPLKTALEAWRVTPLRNPNFRVAVRNRIGAPAGAVGWTRFAQAHGAAVAALVVAAAAIGAWSGRIEAREHSEATRVAIASDYVHALDARWMRRP